MAQPITTTKRTASGPRLNQRRRTADSFSYDPRNRLGHLIQDFNVSLREVGNSMVRRTAFVAKLDELLEDQSNVPPAKADLCLIAQKIYRLEHSKAKRQELCRAVRGFFSYALRHRCVSGEFFQKVLLFFWVPEIELPPGVMSLDEIRTALREAPTLYAKTGLIFALTRDFSALPLDGVTRLDVCRVSRKPGPGTSDDEGIDSLISWLMVLPEDTGLLVGSERDFLAARKVLKQLGFKNLDALRKTRIAYHAALAGPVVKFATGGGISPVSLKKYTVPGLDAWAGYAFHYGITPGSCGIQDWPAGCPVSEPPPRRRRVRTIIDADSARYYF